MLDGDVIMDDILTTKEAAKYLKVGESYICQLIRLKKLRAYEEGRRGGYRILKEDINKYINDKLKLIKPSRKTCESILVPKER